MTIEPLYNIDKTHLSNWGHNGYRSDWKYEAITEAGNEGFHFLIKPRKLEETFVKYWGMDTKEILELNEIVAQGNSFGAYDNGKLIGYIICEDRDWNNTLFIETFLIAESYRGKGIGSLLITALIKHAREKKYRLIELEVQNTNFPAIIFYQKNGFSLTGLNLKLYDKLDEIALYMTYEL